jgi:hypothetical protein
MNNKEFFGGKKFVMCTYEEFEKLRSLSEKYQAPNVIPRVRGFLKNIY